MTASTEGDPRVLVDETRDQTIRWARGERFHHVVEAAVDARDDAEAAVELVDHTVSVAELDGRANQVARHLRALEVTPGARVGLLFGRSAEPLAAMLAVSKAHCAYVPLDAAFPPDRMAHICQDAGVDVVLTTSALAPLLDGVREQAGIRVSALDTPDGAIDTLDNGRLSEDEAGVPRDDIAYVIYTSGTTGRPKGVPIEHASICNFLRVAAEYYGFAPGDRVYQGMTLAFDFSVEETWVPLIAGATLVPATGSGALVGEDLTRFLRDRRITALCCVPTLLATLDADLPELRFLLVSGEACPQDLVRRWHRRGRRFLNVYGPTETTVTATWTELHPDEPVTIGVPLPTYRVVVLDAQHQRPLAFGETGEIAVAGIGLSPGYLNRPELTAEAFVEDPLGLPDNPSERLYRTGDLGRIGADGQIEYLGRIDSQVKVRGYRIELAEIESALMELPGVGQAAVTTHERQPGQIELAGFVTAAGATPVDLASIRRGLADRLPPYMVPASLEQLDRLPMLPSDKVDRARLPEPAANARAATVDVDYVAPEGEAEVALASAMEAALGIERISVTADFFADLGADSLRVSGFCAAVRNSDTLSHVATEDVYRHPTIRSLTAALEATELDGAVGTEAAGREPHVATRAAYLACGIVQGAVYLAYLLLLGVLGTAGFHLLDGVGAVEGWLRSLGFAAAVLVVLTVLPVAVKWTVIGRFDREPIPVWSVGYLRFWAVRTAIRLSPVVLLAGSPAYNLFLRALGVRVGPQALVLTRTAPVCADLVQIGAGAVIREEVAIAGYRVEAGWVIPGPVEIGADSVVGEGSVVDIDTRMGAGAQLVHASSLAEGSGIPAGRRWHGSPARDAGAAEPRGGTAPVNATRRGLYALGQIAGLVAVRAQLAVLTVVIALAVDVSHPLRALAFAAGVLAAFAITLLVIPRVTARLLTDGKSYRLYGLRWSLFQVTNRTSNSRFFNALFGDSAAIVGYLRAIGIRFRTVKQTGSNFGMTQRQNVPALCEVGGETIVSDGFAMVNADYSRHSFRVGQVTIGDRVFIGNRVFYPAGARLGDDCLLATRVLVPTDGPIRSGVGLLGSPAFEIPRTVARDTRFDHMREGDALRRGLARKLRHNAGSMALFLATRWALLFLAVTAIATIGHDGALGLAAALLVSTVAGLLLLAGVDCAARGFRRLVPRYCSLYDPVFWRHERYWKLNDPVVLTLFDGTPFKALAWRAFGAKVGRRLFDDGATMPERSMVTIGDDVTLGAGSVLHGHSLEDGTFKSGPITLGAGVTIGPGAWVHYDVEVAEEATVATDSFVIKGERLEARSRWRGNPARRQPIVS